MDASICDTMNNDARKLDLTTHWLDFNHIQSIKTLLANVNLLKIP